MYAVFLERLKSLKRKLMTLNVRLSNGAALYQQICRIDAHKTTQCIAQHCGTVNDPRVRFFNVIVCCERPTMPCSYGIVTFLLHFL